MLSTRISQNLGSCRENFWTELNDYMIQKQSSVKLQKPKPSNHINASIGRARTSVSQYTWINERHENPCGNLYGGTGC